MSRQLKAVPWVLSEPPPSRRLGWPRLSLEERNRRWYLGGGIFSLTIIGLALVILILRAAEFYPKEERRLKGPTPSPISPAPEPAKETAPSFNRADWPLEVLNGSAVSGAARRLASELEGLGYPIVKVGDAERSDYQVSALYVRPSLRSAAVGLLADLNDRLSQPSIAGELPEGPVAARIIIGSQ